MKGSKLLSLLSSLSSTELRRMRKIFQSPFFTTNDRHLVLYDLLRKYHPDFTSLKLSKEQVFEKLYPNKSFNDGLLRVLLREFTKMVEEYLLLLELRKDKLERKKMLVRIYNDRNLYSFFVKETQKIIRGLEEGAFRHSNHYREIYELNFAYFFHPFTEKLPESDAPLLEMMNKLDKQFTLDKFRIGSEMLNRNRIYAKQYDVRLLDELKEMAATEFAKDDAHFKLFLLLFRSYESTEKDDAQNFSNFKAAFSEYFEKLPALDQSLFFTQLINFTIRKINLGESAYFKEALDLYKIALEANLVLEQGSIDEGVYGNIVSVGCYAQEFDWVKQFMIDYKNNLKEEIREDTHELNRGLYFFHQKNYEKARYQFMNHGYSPKFQMKARGLLVKTLFEEFLKDLSLFDLLIAQINAFEKYLHRNALSNEYKKEASLNFISILKKITNGIFKNKDIEKIKIDIKKQIEQKNNMIGKTWLNEKLKDWK